MYRIEWLLKGKCTSAGDRVTSSRVKKKSLRVPSGGEVCVIFGCIWETYHGGWGQLHDLNMELNATQREVGEFRLARFGYLVSKHD